MLATLRRLSPLALCLSVLRWPSVRLLGSDACEVKTGALVQIIYLVVGDRLLSVVFGTWAGGIGKIV